MAHFKTASSSVNSYAHDKILNLAAINESSQWGNATWVSKPS